ncbi:metallophosphoesterase family protein [Thermosynechococcus sp. GLH187]|uniref:metallophosphoesterase family protein n=1 Tax=unclassified Thermosynechococcus TaxID=2622553 RepID=UPI002877DEF1|nr:MULTISPECIES: metallophosphoesterase family protein [unclassified Thermosynechococcus]WNC45565.1 metallophosphoesterase family protein [Thermosynechococcus sp. GLH187]WNC48101.1 metallophosphoesterase family protein [Thermosynechococcus sp. GLH333]WNC50634.1 metallophosphoesterase family protein [Thermosynechococcus sp. GLH87]
MGDRAAWPKDNRLVLIGDVHGHYEGLCRLLDLVSPRVGDRLYFLGDLVDRGPSSAAVVEFVRQGGYGAVRGNHEDMMLLAFKGKQINPAQLFVWSRSGGNETLASYTSTELLWQHFDWLHRLPLYQDLGTVFIVHAGLDPTLPLVQQTSKECCWIRESFLGHPIPYFADKTIVVGHTITFTFPNVEAGQIVRGAGWIDIETGAYHRRSGWLTALDWTNQWVYQVNVLYGGTRQGELETFLVDLADFSWSTS